MNQFGLQQTGPKRMTVRLDMERIGTMDQERDGRWMLRFYIEPTTDDAMSAAVDVTHVLANATAMKGVLASEYGKVRELVTP